MNIQKKQVRRKSKIDINNNYFRKNLILTLRIQILLVYETFFYKVSRIIESVEKIFLGCATNAKNFFMK